MTYFLDLKVFGEEQFAREILRVGERGAHPKPVLEKIKGDWVMWNMEQFVSQGARSSGGWDKLAESTIKAKGHNIILFDTGGLEAEVTDPSNIDVGDDWLHLTLPDREDRIGGFHQGGTRHMPQRRVIEFTELDKREMVRDIQLWVIKGELR